MHLKEMTLQCLYPNADETAADCNGLSQVWEIVEVMHFRCCLPGDLGEETGKTIIKSDNVCIRSQH